MKLYRLLPIAFAILPLHAAAEVALPKVLADHMVLQRGVTIHLWGLASPGEKVDVALEEDRATANADALGRWSVKLPPRAAGGPYKLSFHGSSNTVELKDVLIGDLWVASGQSNMEIPLTGFGKGAPIKDADAEIAAAKYPQIRFLKIGKSSSEYPLQDVKDPATWQVCAPETAGAFSAVAYFFARDLHLQEKVPIGIIDSTWGGTPVEAWVSMDALSRTPIIGKVMEARASDMDAEEGLLLQRGLDKVARAAGKTVRNRPMDYVLPWEPATLYNAMIAPLINLPIRGVIWYQGESNTTKVRAPLYETEFEALIEDWRTRWKNARMPFLYVQLASLQAGPEWVAIREAQRRALRLPNTGMAVAIDVGEENNIHPAQKQPVGHRLALQAFSIAYGEKLVHDGPLFSHATPAGGAIRVFFDSAAGLIATGGSPGGFEVAGVDGVFVAATAVIEGETVVASSTTVPQPVAVRYAWAAWPKGANLYNGANLPASPFTSVPAPSAVSLELLP